MAARLVAREIDAGTGRLEDLSVTKDGIRSRSRLESEARHRRGRPVHEQAAVVARAGLPASGLAVAGAGRAARGWYCHRSSFVLRHGAAGRRRRMIARLDAVSLAGWRAHAWEGGPDDWNDVRARVPEDRQRVRDGGGPSAAPGWSWVCRAATSSSSPRPTMSSKTRAARPVDPDRHCRRAASRSMARRSSSTTRGSTRGPAPACARPREPVRRAGTDCATAPPAATSR